MKAEHRKKRVSPRFTVEQRAAWVLVIAIIAALCGLPSWFALQRSQTANLNPPRTAVRAQAAPDVPNANANVDKKPGRIVYAYSVVPGGVTSVAELKLAMARDSVVFDQYSAFHVAKARIIRLDHDRLAHVAYRMGNRVYWTKGALKLKKGETLITDGVQTARTRCGNFVSSDLPGPVSPNEPLESALNAPAGIINRIYEPGEPIGDNRFPELQPPPSTPVPPTSYEPPVEGNPFVGGGPGPVPGPGPFFIPPPVPIRPPSGSPPPTSTPPSPPPKTTPPGMVPPVPPVINAPEPGTGIQFLLSLAGILILLGRAKRKSALEGVRRTR